MKKYDYLVVGAGLYGAVFAQQAKEAGTVEKPAKLEGRNMVMFLAPISTK